MTTTSTSCSAMRESYPMRTKASGLILCMHTFGPDPFVRVPAASGAVVEDDDVAAVGRDDLPVATLQRLVGPPAVLDEPRLADRLDVAAADGERAAVGV